MEALTVRDWVAIGQFVITLIGFVIIVANIKFQNDANTKAIATEGTARKEAIAAQALSSEKALDALKDSLEKSLESHKKDTEIANTKFELSTKECINRVDGNLLALSKDVKEIREANYGQVLKSLANGIEDLKGLLKGCIWNAVRPDEFVRQTEMKEYPTRKEVAHLISDKVQHASSSSAN